MTMPVTEGESEQRLHLSLNLPKNLAWDLRADVCEVKDLHLSLELLDTSATPSSNLEVRLVEMMASIGGPGGGGDGHDDESTPDDEPPPGCLRGPPVEDDEDFGDELLVNLASLSTSTSGQSHCQKVGSTTSRASSEGK